MEHNLTSLHDQVQPVQVAAQRERPNYPSRSCVGISATHSRTALVAEMVNERGLDVHYVTVRALGAGVWARNRQALPTTPASHKRFLESG